MESNTLVDMLVDKFSCKLNLSKFRDDCPLFADETCRQQQEHHHGTADALLLVSYLLSVYFGGTRLGLGEVTTI